MRRESSGHRGRWKRRGNKPGPRPSACPWCAMTDCNHCRCPGYTKCDHAPGEPCKRCRYKRRRVCNPCEKHKLADRLAARKLAEAGGAVDEGQPLDDVGPLQAAHPAEGAGGAAASAPSGGLDLVQMVRSSGVATRRSGGGSGGSAGHRGKAASARSSASAHERSEPPRTRRRVGNGDGVAGGHRSATPDAFSHITGRFMAGGSLVPSSRAHGGAMAQGSHLAQAGPGHADGGGGGTSEHMAAAASLLSISRRGSVDSTHGGGGGDDDEAVGTRRRSRSGSLPGLLLVQDAGEGSHSGGHGSQQRHSHPHGTRSRAHSMSGVGRDVLGSPAWAEAAGVLAGGPSPGPGMGHRDTPGTLVATHLHDEGGRGATGDGNSGAVNIFGDGSKPNPRAGLGHRLSLDSVCGALLQSPNPDGAVGEAEDQPEEVKQFLERQQRQQQQQGGDGLGGAAGDATPAASAAGGVLAGRAMAAAAATPASTGVADRGSGAPSSVRLAVDTTPLRWSLYRHSQTRRRGSSAASGQASDGALAAGHGTQVQDTAGGGGGGGGVPTRRRARSVAIKDESEMVAAEGKGGDGGAAGGPGGESEGEEPDAIYLASPPVVLEDIGTVPLRAAEGKEEGASGQAAYWLSELREYVQRTGVLMAWMQQSAAAGALAKHVWTVVEKRRRRTAGGGGGKGAGESASTAATSSTAAVASAAAAAATASPMPTRTQSRSGPDASPPSASPTAMAEEVGPPMVTDAEFAFSSNDSATPVPRGMEASSSAWEHSAPAAPAGPGGVESGPRSLTLRLMMLTLSYPGTGDLPPLKVVLRAAHEDAVRAIGPDFAWGEFPSTKTRRGSADSLDLLSSAASAAAAAAQQGSTPGAPSRTSAAEGTEAGTGPQAIGGDASGQQGRHSSLQAATAQRVQQAATAAASAAAASMALGSGADPLAYVRQLPAEVQHAIMRDLLLRNSTVSAQGPPASSMPIPTVHAARTPQQQQYQQQYQQQQHQQQVPRSAQGMTPVLVSGPGGMALHGLPTTAGMSMGMVGSLPGTQAGRLAMGVPPMAFRSGQAPGVAGAPMQGTVHVGTSGAQAFLAASAAAAARVTPQPTAVPTTAAAAGGQLRWTTIPSTGGAAQGGAPPGAGFAPATVPKRE